MKKLILLCFAIFLVFAVKSYSGYYNTLSTIQNQVRVLLRDNNSDTTKRRWTDAELTERINLVQNSMVMRTMCLQGRAKLTTETNRAEYRLPDDCMKVLRVAYEISASTGNYYKLGWSSLAGQDKTKYWEQTPAGQPTEYYSRRNFIGFKPKPSASYSGADKARIDYVVIPSTLSASTDVPFNGDYSLYSFHEGIVYGTVALCLWAEGNTTEFTLAETKYREIITLLEKTYYTEPDKNVDFTK